jgi:hypothetical protein
MLIKTKIALSALLVVGFASAALAGEDPTNKIGDRYPFLEQTVQQSAGASAFASAGSRISVRHFTADERALFARVKGTW